MKNYFKDKSKKYPRFTLAIGKFLTHNQHRTNNPSDIYSQCGCEHFKPGKRKYYSDGTNLHMDSIVINSNTDAITSIDVTITK